MNGLKLAIMAILVVAVLAVGGLWFNPVGTSGNDDPPPCVELRQMATEDENPGPVTVTCRNPDGSVGRVTFGGDFYDGDKPREEVH